MNFCENNRFCDKIRIVNKLYLEFNYNDVLFVFKKYIQGYLQNVCGGEGVIYWFGVVEEGCIFVVVLINEGVVYYF